jgi:hypothetical protein
VNREEAKRILELYRPGTADARDPEIAAAIELTRGDAEFQRWFEQHCVLQGALRRKFRDLPVSAARKASILAQRKIVRPEAWWRSPVWLAAAAAVVLLAGLASLWLRPRPTDRFADFRARMVSTALRVGTYQMSIVTNDMVPVRQFMAARGAPADYALTRGLGALPLTGGDVLQWRGHPVSMVCFDRGDKQMLYLFVLPRTAFTDPPPSAPVLAKVNKLQTASWTEGDKAYLLAGPDEADFGRRYL